MTATPDISPELMAYFAGRQRQRAQAVADVLNRLTERELLLVKEAAVMGFVQGVMHQRDTGDKIPGDRAILMSVVEDVLAFPENYPTLANYTESDEADQ